ncbi:DivIVA domain-containing protein [Micromonospora sp. WMMD882]|uniref:DivIVA domain-containing protein n=1 Tax=Micromonospora sp. WMMD882 TaxID=3015151 RepID=UPI00248CAAB5|nr:DivIVA domain-containing protein [Micromonospora sp. WMMD882]WBB82383.1 DivIVA domain-containing protein [Micromonospora sp. WMMD882]
MGEPWESHAESGRPDAAEARGTAYRSAVPGPLRPWQVRGKLFTPRGRHGVDAAEVRHFLDRVADDLTACYAEVARAHAENDRIKTALRQWQSELARRELAGIR